MSDIKLQTQGRWLSILPWFGVDEKCLNGRHGPCPLCGGEDRFRFTDFMQHGGVICNQCMPPSEKVDGLEFLQRLTGQSFSDVAKEIREILCETTALPPQKIDLSKVRNSLMKTWRESKKLSKGDPVHRYLLARGLAGIEFSKLKNLRYHESQPYYTQTDDGPKMTGKHPAMIARVQTPDGTPATLHITYLTPDGRKADVDPVRKIKPPAIEYKGGAVRLLPPAEGKAIVVAEGIETVLAFWKKEPDCIPWSCLNAGNLESFMPPEHTAVVIGGDNDESFTGQAAAFALAKRLAGKHPVRVEIPEHTGDWNSVISRGVAA